VVAPTGQTEAMNNAANENEEEVHQVPSVSTRIEVVDSYYLGAGSVVGTQTPRFRRLYEEQQRAAPDNIHYPFENEDEWQYGTWMSQSGLPLTEMDKLLNLAYVRWFPTRILQALTKFIVWMDVDQKAAFFVSNRSSSPHKD
jgi:hypothetical protein